MRQSGTTPLLHSELRRPRRAAHRYGLRVAGVFLGILALGAAVGCQNQRQALERLEEENFLLSERITELETELLLCRRQAERESRSTSRRERWQDELPSTDAPELIPPGGDQRTPRTRPEPRPAPVGPTSRTDAPRHTASARPMPRGPAASIVIDTLRTTGLDETSAPGDEGVLVVVEAYDEFQRRTAPSGSFDLALWDEELLEQYKDDPVNRNLARLAVWKYDPQAAATCLVEGDDGQPVAEFRLIWPNQRPQHERLRVYIRYTAPDGKVLLADAPVTVALSGRRGPPAVARPPAKLSSTRGDGNSAASRGGSERSALLAAEDATGWLSEDRLDTTSRSAASEHSHDGAREANRAAKDRPRWKPYR